MAKAMPDPEFAAMRKITKLLEPLAPSARRRVIEYARNRAAADLADELPVKYVATAPFGNAETR